MDRPWSRLAIRATSVGLLLAGLVGGVYLGQNRDAERSATAGPASIQRVEAADMQLLKQRQSAHAAARARQRQAESTAGRTAATEARTAAAEARRLEAKAIKKKAREAAGPVPYDGPIPDSCTEYSGSRAIGCSLMLEAGFEIAEFPCLEKLWTKESGWNYKAENPGSGAYGIPQALPGDKMASAGADWKTNPATQIEWGLGYVKGRYNTPCGAWTHFQNTGSY